MVILKENSRVEIYKYIIKPEWTKTIGEGKIQYAGLKLGNYIFNYTISNFFDDDIDETVDLGEINDENVQKNIFLNPIIDTWPPNNREKQPTTQQIKLSTIGDITWKNTNQTTRYKYYILYEKIGNNWIRPSDSDRFESNPLGEPEYRQYLELKEDVEYKISAFYGENKYYVGDTDPITIVDDRITLTMEFVYDFYDNTTNKWIEKEFVPDSNGGIIVSRSDNTIIEKRTKTNYGTNYPDGFWLLERNNDYKIKITKSNWFYETRIYEETFTISQNFDSGSYLHKNELLHKKIVLKPTFKAQIKIKYLFNKIEKKPLHLIN